MEKHWVKALITAVLVCLGVQDQLIASEAKPEKCYGIVKKGNNDCAGHDHSCQGQATKDQDPDEWIFLPEGTCKKIVGGEVKGK